MVGYRRGSLKWIGYSGAKLDDLLTWIPCRLVLISLPLVSQPLYLTPKLIKSAIIYGRKYSSPNSGISEAIFAYCLNIRMGGENSYSNKKVVKPILAKEAPNADPKSIELLLKTIFKLQLFWVIILIIISFLLKL
tara:strand:+ start:115 stop:519 length:405 start_codon:yes stop_codon:yes gene_type:complete